MNLVQRSRPGERHAAVHLRATTVLEALLPSCVDPWWPRADGRLRPAEDALLVSTARLERHEATWRALFERDDELTEPLGAELAFAGTSGDAAWRDVKGGHKVTKMPRPPKEESSDLLFRFASGLRSLSAAAKRGAPVMMTMRASPAHEVILEVGGELDRRSLTADEKHLVAAHVLRALAGDEHAAYGAVLVLTQMRNVRKIVSIDELLPALTDALSRHEKVADEGWLVLSDIAAHVTPEAYETHIRGRLAKLRPASSPVSVHAAGKWLERGFDVTSFTPHLEQVIAKKFYTSSEAKKLLKALVKKAAGTPVKEAKPRKRSRKASA